MITLFQSKTYETLENDLRSITLKMENPIYIKNIYKNLKQHSTSRIE